MGWEEACRILGVEPGASSEEIRQQYYYKAQLLHPDKTIGRPESIRRKAADEFKLVNQAYQFLTDPLNNPFTNPPRLKVSPKHIRFRDVEIGQRKTTSFEVSNIGGPYTSIWFEREPSAWLSVTSFRSTTTEQLPMEVTIECTGAGEQGKQYSCRLPVRLENAKTKLKDEVALDIELWTKATRPALSADTSKIEFTGLITGTSETREVTLSNVGHGVLEGVISTSRPWLSVLPGSVRLGPSESRPYSVVVNTDTLPSGFVDRAEACFRTNGGAATLVVDLSVADRVYKQHRSYSVKEFLKRLFLVLAFPFIPPILIGTVYLLRFLAARSLVWLFVVLLVAAAVILADRRARQGVKAPARIAEPHEDPSVTATPLPPPPPGSRPAQSGVVANTIGFTYHRPSCKWAKKIPRRNRANMTRDEAERRCFYPCSVCRP